MSQSNRENNRAAGVCACHNKRFKTNVGWKPKKQKREKIQARGKDEQEEKEEEEELKEEEKKDEEKEEEEKQKEEEDDEE